MKPLDPESAAMLAAGADAPSISEGTIAEARALMAQLGSMCSPGPELHDVSDCSIPGPRGKLAARHYRPGPDTPGVIVFVHGGGWVMGTLDDFDACARRLAVASGCDIVAVDYALAPEHPFPAAPDDVYAATEWVSRTVAAGRPLVLLGESAGATLAAVTARRSRDRGGPPVSLQVLLYPPTDTDFERASYRNLGGGEYLNSTEDIRWFWDRYAPRAADRDDPDAVPLRAPSLRSLAPAIVMLCGYDILRDEGSAYVEALRRDDVPVTLLDVEDQFHSFWIFVNVLASADAWVDRVGALVSDHVGSER